LNLTVQLLHFLPCRSLVIIPNLTEHYKINTNAFTTLNRIQHPTQNVQFKMTYYLYGRPPLILFNFLKTQSAFITCITLLLNLEMEKHNFKLENANTVQEQ